MLCLSGINSKRKAVGQQLRGSQKGVEGEESRGKTPRGEACLGPPFKPVKTRSYEIVPRFTQYGEQSQGCCIGMGSEGKSVDDSVASVPSSPGAYSVVQHLHSPPDTE